MSTDVSFRANSPGRAAGHGLQGMEVLSFCPEAETATHVRGFFSALGVKIREASQPRDLAAMARESLPDFVLLEVTPASHDLVMVCGCLRAIWGSDQRPLVGLVPPRRQDLRERWAECRFDDFIELPLVTGGADRQLAALRPGPPIPPGRTEALQRLDGSRRFTETLLAQIHSGVVAADAGGRITFANRSALETLGLEIGECIGRDLVATFGSSQQLERALLAVADGGETRADLTVRTKAAALDIGMTLLRTTDIAPPDMTFVLLFRNVSDRLHFEMELRRVERISAIGHMVAGFAHEIRNPLAGIQALAEALLLELPDEDRRREYPERMLVLLSRVERFVNATLRFGEPKAARPSSQQADVLVRNALDALVSRWGRRGNPPRLTVPSFPPSVCCDEAQITEALLALMENAIDAAGDSSGVQVRVHAERAEGLLKGVVRMVQFDVSDDGPGVPEALLARIFDPFFTTKANGTGLGLPLAQSLVRENGGRLLVNSTPGAGSTFSLILPEAES